MAGPVRSASIFVFTLATFFVFAAEHSEPEQTPAFPRLFLRDVVVSNTDRSLRNRDNYLNSEPGIAINPVDPTKIVVSSFSGAWTVEGQGPPANAPLWYSSNGGRLWTKEGSSALLVKPNSILRFQHTSNE